MGRGAEAAGTNGGADGTAAEPVGGVNGDTGAGDDAGGVKGGTGGDVLNSGIALAGEGGVAVAVTGPLSTGSTRAGRGAPEASGALGDGVGAAGCGAGAAR